MNSSKLSVSFVEKMKDLLGEQPRACEIRGNTLKISTVKFASFASTAFPSDGANGKKAC